MNELRKSLEFCNFIELQCRLERADKWVRNKSNCCHVFSPSAKGAQIKCDVERVIELERKSV